MMEWEYDSKLRDFIKLPDGTVINMGHVRRVFQLNGGYNVCIDTGTVDTTAYPVVYYDPDGKIYAWFAEWAVEVGG